MQGIRPARVQRLAFNPSSINLLTASERVVSFLFAQSSISAIISFGTLTGKFGSRPPLDGRPRLRFFGGTVIDFSIIGDTKKRADGK